MANMAQEPDIADFILLPTIILRLLNMFDTTEDEEKQDILTDIKEECQDFGPVLSVTSHKKTDIDLEYNVYVEFKNAADCEKAQKMLTGRYFNGRLVIATFFPVQDFLKKHFY